MVVTEDFLSAQPAGTSSAVHGTVHYLSSVLLQGTELWHFSTKPSMIYTVQRHRVVRYKKITEAVRMRVLLFFFFAEPITACIYSNQKIKADNIILI